MCMSPRPAIISELKMASCARSPVPPQPACATWPIDDFLESLAKERGNLAFGIILSGTASDGTLGLKAIKAEGGITLAQEPSSAKFDGMPSSAIAAGAVDFVLTPEAIAKQLVSLASHPYLNLRPADGASRRNRSTGRRRSHSDLHSAASGDRHRFHVLQAQHHPAAHRTPHGASRNGEPEGLRAQTPPGRRRGEDSGAGISHQRHRVFSRARNV